MKTRATSPRPIRRHLSAAQKVISFALAIGLLFVTGRLSLAASESGRSSSNESRRVPTWALIAGTMGGALCLDHSVRRWGERASSTHSADRLAKIGDYGNGAGLIGGVLFGLGARMSGRPRLEETSLLAFQSVIAGSAAAYATKAMVGRTRPFQSNPDRFHFGSMQVASSFPSGHTVAAFSMATILSEQYPSPAVAIPSYAFAGFVGFSRIYSNKHWASDVAAGAFLGVFVGRGLVARLRRTRSGDVEILMNGDSIYLAKRFSFGGKNIDASPSSLERKNG